MSNNSKNCRIIIRISQLQAFWFACQGSTIAQDKDILQSSRNDVLHFLKGAKPLSEQEKKEATDRTHQLLADIAAAKRNRQMFVLTKVLQFNVLELYFFKQQRYRFIFSYSFKTHDDDFSQQILFKTKPNYVPIDRRLYYRNNFILNILSPTTSGFKSVHVT